jgi:hypothetical protein
MNLFNRLQRGKKQNPYYKKLSEVLSKQGLNLNIRKAYFMFGIPYTDESVHEIKQAIVNKTLDDFRDKRHYNVNVDNIELYLLEDVNDKTSIALLLDPFELYSSENIIEIIPVTYTNFEKEIIFP